MCWLKNLEWLYSARNQGFHSDAMVGRCHGHCAAQCEHSPTHADHAETLLMIGRQASAIVADAHHDRLCLVGSRRRLDSDIDACRASVAEDVGEGLLNDAIDRQFRRLAARAERRRDRGFDDDTRMSFTPKTH